MNSYRSEPIQTLTLTSVEHIIRSWPASSSTVARSLIKKYGLPHEAAPTGLVWYYNGPWAKTMVSRDGVRHIFPNAHLDVLEQTLRYRVLPEKIAELALYNGSLTVNPTRGEISICCSDEDVNFLSMNLGHEIILGLTTSSEAKERHRQIMNGRRLLWPEMAMEGLQFEVVAQGYGVEESVERKNAFA